MLRLKRFQLNSLQLRYTAVNKHHFISRGLLGYWVFDSYAGNFQARDISGNNNHAISAGGTGGLRWNQDGPKNNHKLSFATLENVGDYIDMGPMIPLVSAPRFSSLCLVRRRNLTNVAVLYGKDGELTLNLWNDGQIYFNNNGSLGSITTNDLNWHHVIYTFDGTNPTSGNRAFAYLDGRQTNLGGGPTTLTSNTGNMNFGRRPGTGNAGVIDMALYIFWDRALTQTEASILYTDPLCMLKPYLPYSYVWDSITDTPVVTPGTRRIRGHGINR